MNLVELDHALRKLRLSGMADVLQTRLHQAQTEKTAPIDLVSALVGDELTRRQDRLFGRRLKQAAFRDADRSLDSFDFAFNKKMNRVLVYDLATARFVAQREDALFLGPPGTGKSHLAQAIGRAAIQQGHRVVYREAHVLIEQIADASIDGTRKQLLADLATVPLLIVDDLGMRKLPHTAAEDLLELIMRRYERASTILTSNRPVEDWGKLLGDTAAVTALLDRLLHHAHVLKCGPRSWRTKIHTDLRPEEVRARNQPVSIAPLVAGLTRSLVAGFEVIPKVVARPSAPAGLVRRARIVLLSVEGVSGGEIAVRLDLSPEHVSRIRKRFRTEGVPGLTARPKSGRQDHAVPRETVERVIQLAMSPPPAGRSRWTTRLLGKKVGLTSGCISDLLRENGLKPHLVRTYKVSRDPEFTAKVKDVVGLYLNPPDNAVVLSVDEKTSIQALQRAQMPLPLRTGRAVRHTHNYKRHGVVDLYAALEVATGKVTHKLTDAHTAIDFLGFMKKVVRAYAKQELHVILDNSSPRHRGLARRAS